MIKSRQNILFSLCVLSTYYVSKSTTAESNPKVPFSFTYIIHRYPQVGVVVTPIPGFYHSPSLPPNC